MAAQRTANTQEEILRKLLNQLNDADVAEDADPTYLTLLRALITQKLRDPIDQQAQAMGAPADPFAGMPGGAVPQPGGAMPGGGLGGMPPGAGLAGPVGAAPVPGVRSGLDRSAPPPSGTVGNPDELRRMLAGPG